MQALNHHNNHEGKLSRVCTYEKAFVVCILGDAPTKLCLCIENSIGGALQGGDEAETHDTKNYVSLAVLSWT